jgi:hypothetical protein
MTHDELLERVNRIKIVSCDENIDFEHVHSLNEPKACNECLTCMGLSALYTVVELHKPVMAFTGGYDGEENELWAEQCQECSGSWASQMYPCPTIQAIEKELK